jgi:hypothetical protein
VTGFNFELGLNSVRDTTAEARSSRLLKNPMLTADI